MDQIDYSVSLGRHITKNKKILNKSWRDFFCAIKNKKIILYGINEILNLLWIRAKDFSEKILITAAIDNDIGKKNLPLNIFFDEDNLNEIKICPKSELKNFSSDEVVILISSMLHYNEITNELEQMNFKYFSVLNLEYHHREKNSDVVNLDEYKKNFAESCAENLSIDEKKIIFYGFGGYADHEKYITEKLLQMNHDLKLVWIVKKFPVDVPEGVEIIFNGNFKKYIRAMETAKIWIFDVPIEIDLIKREEQIYIQTKHWGSITLKKFYLDTPNVSQVKDNKYYWQKNSQWMDYIISGSEFDEKSCRSGFNFNGKFLRFGSPRSDAMFESKKFKSKISKEFNLNETDKILLYAPTFRFRNAKAGDIEIIAEDFLNFDLLMQSLKEKFFGEWKIFLRLHPHLRSKSKKLSKPNYVIDVTDYDDNQELASAADIMISDYSSFMFEFAYVLKPIFLYAPDVEEYILNERELLINYYSLPFPISKTDEELSNQIKNFDEKNYRERIKNFLNRYGINEDGHSSERVAKFILNLLEVKA